VFQDITVRVRSFANETGIHRLLKCVSDNSTEFCFSIDGSAIHATIILWKPLRDTCSTIELLAVGALLGINDDVVANRTIECLVWRLVERII
jgi:hypothetical protein